MTDHFGRVPVRARQWVRHMISLPDRKSLLHFSDPQPSLTMMLQQKDKAGPTMRTRTSSCSTQLTGSSQGAYQRQDLVTESSAQNWIDNFNQDPNVPDTYSQTNMIEDVAQASVIAAFDTNVPGGYGSIEPKAASIFHQYATIDTMQREAGNLLVPGGSCTRRLANSQPVQAGATTRMSRVMRARDMGMPDVSLADELEIIPAKEFSTKEICSRPH